MNKRIREKLKEAKAGEININNSIFFLPQDFRELKLKGKWMLCIKKGLLTRLDKEDKKKNKN